MSEIAYDIQAIRARLPHRYPFLMIDRILKSTPGYALGLKNVTVNEPFFQGHFPQFSIMPGVLIAEAVLQTAAFMAPQENSPVVESRHGKRYFCVGMNVKFQRPVIPGDSLLIEVRFVRQMGDLSKVKGTVKTATTIIANGDFNLAVLSSEENKEL